MTKFMTYEEFLKRFPVPDEVLNITQEQVLMLEAETNIDYWDNVERFNHVQYQCYLNGDPFYWDQLDEPYPGNP